MDLPSHVTCSVAQLMQFQNMSNVSISMSYKFANAWQKEHSKEELDIFLKNWSCHLSVLQMTEFQNMPMVSISTQFTHFTISCFTHLSKCFKRFSPVSLANLLMGRGNQHQDESVRILASSEDCTFECGQIDLAIWTNTCSNPWQFEIWTHRFGNLDKYTPYVTTF